MQPAHSTAPEAGIPDVATRIDALLDSIASLDDLDDVSWNAVETFNDTPAPRSRDVLDSTILVVDDEAINAKLACKYLKDDGFQHIEARTNPREALPFLQKHGADLVLLDVVMPELSGQEVLSKIRADLSLKHLPVIVLTAEDNREVRLDMLNRGATDFLQKPVDPVELNVRIRNTLTTESFRQQLANYASDLELKVRERTKALSRSQIQLIRCLARAGEYRDDDTGQHVYRVGQFCSVLARELGMDKQFVEMIGLAAQLHDVGKIGIPDSILLKPGKLTTDEFDVMREHCRYGTGVFGVKAASPEDSQADSSHSLMGARLLRLADTPLTKMAASIALTHHEQWDGSGYPLGLAGEDIPIEGRITAVADVFDALSSKRPYKDPFPLAVCFDMIRDKRGTHFEPRLVDAFLGCREEITRIRQQHSS